MKKPWFWKRWFLQGLIITLPILLTASLLQWVVVKTDSLLSLVSPVAFPGLGLVVVFFGLIAAGALTESVIIQKCLSLFHWIIGKVPIIRAVYATVTQTVKAILASEDKFSKVVMLEFPRKGIYAVGFITSDTSPDLCSSPEDGPMVNVFLPMSPFLTSGYCLMVPTNQLRILNITVKEAFQLIMSMGIVQKENSNA